mgnify:FL=1
MKSKNVLCYAGYAVSLALIVIIALTDLPLQIDTALGIVFAAVFSISHTQLLHNKMIQDDSDYRINVLDERNILIKEKAGNITNMITLVLLGIITVVFIAFNYIVPAIMTGLLIAIHPILLIIISTMIEKKI